MTITLTYKGDDNFIVHSYTEDDFEGLANEIGNFSGEVLLLSNEIGDFSGEVLLPDGSILLEVDADKGTWTLKPG